MKKTQFNVEVNAALFFNFLKDDAYKVFFHGSLSKTTNFEFIVLAQWYLKQFFKKFIPEFSEQFNAALHMHIGEYIKNNNIILPCEIEKFIASRESVYLFDISLAELAIEGNAERMEKTGINNEDLDVNPVYCINVIRNLYLNPLQSGDAIWDGLENSVYEAYQERLLDRIANIRNYLLCQVLVIKDLFDRQLY